MIRGSLYDYIHSTIMFGLGSCSDATKASQYLARQIEIVNSSNNSAIREIAIKAIYVAIHDYNTIFDKSVSI